jgi:hypothetical protein
LDEEREARIAAFDARLKSLLGPDRFAQYELANEGDYQAVHNITARYDLPDSLTTQALQVQRAAEAQSAQVRDDPTLSPDQRQASLTAIARETERTLAQTLGQQVFSSYKEYDGDWLARLAETTDRP